jgi:Nucleotidyl transferase AbiEii toxin, Type IV TA system
VLHTKVVEPKTLDLLRQIQSIHEFEDFRLVGGTALALLYGHRKSIDLDLFGQVKFADISFENVLTGFESIKIINNREYIKQYFINDIKVDFVSYPYRWLKNAIVAEGIKLAALEDILAMKLAAITNRGTKKDFIDMYFLLKEYSLDDMLSFYKEKYPDGSPFLVLKSLIYFNDAEDEEMPFMFAPLSWQTVKETIVEHHKQYLH